MRTTPQTILTATEATATKEKAEVAANALSPETN
jgi:hypothetical protein